MFFENRIDAGRKLGAAVKAKGYKAPVVLGIPRGGVPVAAEVARALGCQVAVVVARKLGAPGNPELAIGATTATGATYINPAVAFAAGANDKHIEAEKQKQIAEAKRREETFDGHRRGPVHGRTVIVVDDGVATGATAIAAVRAMKAEGAARVILAIPVGPPEMVELLSKEADEVVCLSIEPSFWAVGQFYDDFSPVEDSEVLATLNEFAKTAVGDTTERIELQRDGVRLVGNLLLPASPPPLPLVVFVHGLGSGKDSPRNVVIAHRLVDSGIATLLFDLSGHGESGHDLRRTEMDAYVADLEAMFSWAKARANVRRESIGIAGSSMGATIAVAALLAGKVTPKTLVLRGPPVTAEDFRRISVPSLVLIGSRDPLHYDVEHGATGCPSLTLSVVEGAGHLFEEPGKLEEALQQTVDWFTTQLKPQSAGAYAQHAG